MRTATSKSSSNRLTLPKKTCSVIECLERRDFFSVSPTLAAPEPEPSAVPMLLPAVQAAREVSKPSSSIWDGATTTTRQVSLVVDV